MKTALYFEVFAILANVDLNLRLKICKIARNFTYRIVAERRVSKS